MKILAIEIENTGVKTEDFKHITAGKEQADNFQADDIISLPRLFQAL